jgi:hypothetical protein
MTKEFLDERYTALSSDIASDVTDPNVDLLNSLYTNEGNFQSVRSAVIRNLHMVGILGVKAGPTASTDWALQFRSSLTAGEVRPSAIIFIHPMFYRALGTKL